MSRNRRFVVGFAAGLVLFLAANLLAAHLRSDCGLMAVLGRSGCADDIRRAGFPLLFWEAGGFDGRSYFEPAMLLLDLACGAVLSGMLGLIATRRL